jgi:hypothetical protein
LVVLGVALAVGLGWSAVAEATDRLRLGGGVGAVRERIHNRSWPQLRAGDHTQLPWHAGQTDWPTGAPCRDHGGRWTCVTPPAHRQPRTHVIIVPQPVYVAPSRSCFVPGYWTHQWVPQTAWQTVYMPGYWAADGTWVDSHYAQQPYTTGSYQPVWVPEQWAC